MFEELTIVGFMILRNCRIVIPRLLRERTLHLAHEGHQGISKCKERLRSKVWWLGMDKDMERICQTCHGCQVTQLPSRPLPMKRSELPTGEYLFVVVDYYSRYFEVDLLKRVRAVDIITSLETLFARYGAPYTLITDNGPQFKDRSLNEFLSVYGVEHLTSPPLSPRANGEVERQNRTLLRAMQIAQVEGSHLTQWRVRAGVNPLVRIQDRSVRDVHQDIWETMCGRRRTGMLGSE